MKLLGIINDNNYKDYIEKGLDGFIFPLKDFSVDYKRYYTLNELKNYFDNNDKLGYVVINKMIFNQELTNLKEILKELEKIKVSGILFYDLAIYNLIKEMKLKIPLILNTTHMVTSTETINTYYNLGVKKAYLTNEITKEEIIRIRENTKSELFILLLGYPIVAIRKRHLLTNFYKNINQTKKKEVLIEEPKTKQKFLVRENNFGTSFFYYKILNLSNFYEKLNKYKDICGILDLSSFESNKALKIVLNYTNFNKEKLDLLLGRNRGFLNRKTIYKVK